MIGEFDDLVYYDFSFKHCIHLILLLQILIENYYE